MRIFYNFCSHVRSAVVLSSIPVELVIVFKSNAGRWENIVKILLAGPRNSRKRPIFYKLCSHVRSAVVLSSIPAELAIVFKSNARRWENIVKILLVGPSNVKIPGKCEFFTIFAFTSVLSSFYHSFLLNL